MKTLQFVFAAAFLAASGSLQAAGTIKTYLVEAAFAPDDAVDWIGQGATPGGDQPVELSRTFRSAAVTGSVAVSRGVAAGNPRSSGPLTINFTSGPVMGVGVQIEDNTAEGFTARMNVYDAAGTLLGATAVTARGASLKPDHVAPFMGMRSSLKEIARVEIDASSAAGFTIRGLKMGLNPIPDNDLFFVNQIFQDLYGRAPSAAELAANLSALQQGASTRAQLAASLFDSAEFHDNAGFLVKCYSALLQRDSEFVQWSQILKVMQGGATQDSALAAFMSTPEFAAAYPDGLSGGPFVTKLHEKLLGRDPEAGELDSWTLKLAQGASRPATIETFLRSPEFELRIASRVNSTLAYLAFLRRAGDAADIERWTEQLNSGAPVADLIAHLISLPEYVARF